MSVGRSMGCAWFAMVACASVTALVAAPQQVPAVSADVPAAAVVLLDEPEVPEVLTGDRWLRHQREDLMPYWEMRPALGTPVGNFPAFRGLDGEYPAPTGETTRGLSTLSRQVYGYSVAFMLTGEERYLDYAKAGIDWIEANAKDPVHGGYYSRLTEDGEPLDALANKDVFNLASLGLGYGMYYNVTRDPEVEAKLLAVRDLVFGKYYDPVGNRVLDALTYDLSTEVDTNSNGGDITNLIVPGSALLLPNHEILSDAGRRAQFRDDLRRVTDILIARHKNSAAPSNRWWFWGRTLRFGTFNAAETDFGHNIKSYELIHNANQVFPDRPWSSLASDRDRLMIRAWDDPVARWNQRLQSFGVDAVERDSEWWTHAEADQTLAALDLTNGFAQSGQLARSSRSFLDVFVDTKSPARETFTRVTRVAADSTLRKSAFGKNMYHVHEHALIMYLHGRAMEGRPARLYYAFPEDQALTAVAEPYWFDATGQTRTVGDELASLPGRRLVEVEFTGLDAVPPPIFPAPDDTIAPTSVATISPDSTEAGWHNSDVVVSLAAADDPNGVGVKEIHAHITAADGALPPKAIIDPGEELVLPALSAENAYEVTYFAVDRLGNREPARTLTVRIDRTPPVVAGLPADRCVIWPPNKKLVHVAHVIGSDSPSGVAGVDVAVTISEAAAPGDVVIVDDTVYVRAVRDDEGPGRTYTVTATVTDMAGNATTDQASCLVPHHPPRS